MLFRFRKIAALLICCIAVNTAYAGGGSTEVTQLANNSELLKSVEEAVKQVDLLTKQVDMFTKEFTKLAGIDKIFRSIGEVAKIYQKVKGIIDKTQGLVYNMANVGEELKQRFKSMGDLKNLAKAEDFVKEVKKIGETQMETVRKTIEATGMAMEELTTTDAQALSEIQKVAQKADSESQLIQATNNLLAFMAEDAMKLRHAVMMQTQMTGTAIEAERAKETAAQVEHELLYKPVELNKNVDTSDTVEKLHSNW